MRLTEDQIKQGILHADPDVRFACLYYFADCYCPNPTVMPVVIEALERFGLLGAFRFTHPIRHLAQTEPTIRWVIEDLKSQPRNTEEQRNYLNTLRQVLCNAEPGLILPLEKAILSLPGFANDYAERFSRRLQLLSWDGDALWRELEAICEEGKNQRYVDETRFDEGQDIVEALARGGDRHADRMMSLLRVKIEDCANNPMTWMEPLMVQLAGELRYEPALPLVIEKLHEDGDVSKEECQRALVKIGTDTVVAALREAYAKAEWGFRLFAADALGRIHTDLAVEACIDLLAKEEDYDLKDWLAQALVHHFSHEGNEAARTMLVDDPDMIDLKLALAPACTLMEQNFPELEEWRKEIEESWGRKSLPPDPAWSPPPKKALTPHPLPPLSPISKMEKKVGRNDPCPCGSGKKFKKCCLSKQSVV